MKQLKNIILVITALFIIAGCTHKTPYTNRSQMIFMSSQEELALGEQSYKQALSKAKIVNNTYDARRVKSIGAKIAAAANRPDFKWEFNLVEDTAMNAFYKKMY